MRPLEPGVHVRSYTLLHLLGRGGDAEVWLARTPQDTEVAIKLVPRSGGNKERRIRAEFERLRTMRIPQVPRVLDVGADQGYLYYTMDVAQGDAFDAYVAQGASLEARVARATRAGAGVARALTGIHRLGLAHRDLKPANVVVDNDGGVMLVDFGTALFGVAEDSLDEVQGTVAFMAPEQRLGHSHDHRVDSYALGVVLYESLAGRPKGVKPGRPRPSLAMLGAAVPLALAHLVDRLLALDPAARPSAEEAEALLSGLARGDRPPPAPWPSPVDYIGDPSALMGGSCAVVGPVGSGRRRLIEEARWLWYRKGYRSLAGHCEPDRPYGAVCQVLGELFTERDPERRRRLAGLEARTLACIWPDLPVPVDEPVSWPPVPERVGAQLAAVLARAAPIAVVFTELQCADPGTAAMLGALVREAPEDVVVWVSSTSPHPDLPTVHPLAWTAESEARAIETLLPADVRPIGPAGPSALSSVARAWRGLARFRRQPAPAQEVTGGMELLAVLEEPFGVEVATALTREVFDLLAAGHLEEVGEDLRFADRGTRALTLAASADPAELHNRAAQAWRRGRSPDLPVRVAHHAVRSGAPRSDQLAQAAAWELERRNSVEALRWVRLKDLYCAGEDEGFLMSFSRLYAELEVAPNQVRRGDLQDLAARATSSQNRGRAALLFLVHEGRCGDPRKAADLGRKWADRLAGAYPGIAANMLQVGALALMGLDEVEQALVDCREALALAREATWREEEDVTHARSEDADNVTMPGLQAVPGSGPSRLSETEMSVATTLSAALIMSGRLREAERLCQDMAVRCEERGMHRGHGGFLANQAAVQLFMGDRDGASDSLVRCRDLQRLHRDPAVLANASLYQARLALERGDLSAGRQLVDEAMVLAHANPDTNLVGECWTLVLEAAVHAADVVEATRALKAYGSGGVGHNRDHWPAVLGRWMWLAGDLKGALAAVNEERLGYAGFSVRAERCRLQLVSGDFETAHNEGQRLADQALSADMKDIAVFGRLVAGAARGVPDAEFAPLVEGTRQSGWVHLYLGALHLDAIRRQLRGENVSMVLRQLRSRATALDHRLYSALAREEGW